MTDEEQSLVKKMVNSHENDDLLVHNRLQNSLPCLAKISLRELVLIIIKQTISQHKNGGNSLDLCLCILGLVKNDDGVVGLDPNRQDSSSSGGPKTSSYNSCFESLLWILSDYPSIVEQLMDPLRVIYEVHFNKLGQQKGGGRNDPTTAAVQPGNASLATGWLNSNAAEQVLDDEQMLALQNGEQQQLSGGFRGGNSSHLNNNYMSSPSQMNHPNNYRTPTAGEQYSHSPHQQQQGSLFRDQQKSLAHQQLQTHQLQLLDRIIGDV